jgi:uncharacterized protein
MLLPVTLVIAGACALIHVWLSVRVSMHRRTHKVSVGDGGNPAVLARIRAHGNFAESAPLFLVLLALVELAVGSATWLWVAGLLFVAARLAHPFGMDRPAPNAARAIGILLSWLLIVALGLYALYLVSTTPRIVSTTYAEAARAST